MDSASIHHSPLTMGFHVLPPAPSRRHGTVPPIRSTVARPKVAAPRDVAARGRRRAGGECQGTDGDGCGDAPRCADHRPKLPTVSATIGRRRVWRRGAVVRSGNPAATAS